MIDLGHVIVERYSNIVMIFFGFCSIHDTLKCSGRCSTIFHIECTDISIPISLPINLLNSVESNPSCAEIYSIVNKINLLHTEWLCIKYKYEKITPITLYFNEHFLFENKCLKVGLMISSDITVSERKKYLKMLINY